MWSWLTHARIGVKFAVAPSGAFAGLLVLAAGAYALLNTIQSDIRYLDGVAFARVEQAARLQVALSQAETKVYEIAALAANSQDAKTLASRTKGLNDALAAVTELTKEITSANADAAKLGEFIRAWQEAAKNAVEMLGTDPAMGFTFMSPAEDAFGQVAGELKRLADATDVARAATAGAAVSKITTAKIGSIALVGLISLVLAVITLALARAISRPVAALTSSMSKLAAGELQVEVPCTGRRDEIGAMADAVEVFKANAIRNQALEAENQAAMQRRQQRSEKLDAGVATFENAARELSESLARSAADLRVTAERMSHASAGVNRQAAAASTAASEASSKTGVVARSAEELAASIAEIAKQVAKSSSITARAASDAERTNQAVEGLANSAQKIGEVIGLIQEIASQTNLLALNATIEAARAGEHGKGFAVVASEVKALANQTAKATEEIAAQISAIQGTTGDTVAAIRQIATTIGEVNEIAAAIAAAVEEQGAATRDIAGTVVQAARGTDEVSTNIAGVTESSGDVGQASTAVLAAAETLSDRAASLRHEVETFLTTVRAA